MNVHTMLLVALALSLVAPLVVQGAPPDWRTRAERTNYRETSTYAETVDYCRRLDAASPWVTFGSFGTSPEGRALPLLVLSKDGAGTPEAARASGKAVVLVQNGIHSGEIDGKEACLALAREIAVTKTLEHLLDSVVLVVIPIYNVDGHERSSPFNRINQDGPDNMGWRATAQNYNLNRDYLKADAPETRAFLALFDAWRPDLFVDTHVTDGADFQYDVLYTLESAGYVAPEVGAYVEKVFQPHVGPALERDGHLARPYFVLHDDHDPSKGLDGFVFAPRFSNGFGALRNRPSILVETHMLKSFEVRTKATYDLLVETLREINRDPAALRDAVRAADARVSALGASYDPARRVPLKFRVGDAATGTTHFRGNEYTIELSDVSGDLRIVYGHGAKDVELPVYDALETVADVAPPTAYIVPAAWTDVVERLQAHGLHLERLAEPVTAEFETYRLTGATWSKQPFENHHPVSFTTTPAVERRTLPAGSVVVRLDRPDALVAVHLLEPAAPDSFAAWGFFDSIFEQKEYGEDYVVEKLAREMMAKDPELRRAFTDRLRTDPAFRGDASARLNFFYERSPYWDSRIGEYPVVRVTSPIALKTVPF